MKKIIISLLCALALLGALSVQAFAANEIKVYVNDQQLSLDVPPAIVEGRSLVPVKTIFEELGAQVQWIAETKTVIATKNNTRIELQVDSKNAVVNGSNIVLDVPAQVQGGRTLVPLKFVGESLDCNVDWNAQTKVITITARESASGTSDTAQPPAATDTAVLTPPAATTPPAVTTSAANAYELYNKANETLSSADSFQMNIKANTVMKSGAETLTTDMSGTIAYVLRSTTDMDMKMDMTTNISGKSAKVTAYYTKGMYYVDAEGQKIKVAMPLDEMMSQVSTANVDFPESAIKDQSVSETANGKVITFTLNAESVTESVESALGDMTASLGAEAKIQYGDIKVTTTLDSADAIKNVDMAFPLVIEVAGEKIEATYDIKMEITKIGGVTITFPSDLSSYKNASA